MNKDEKLKRLNKEWQKLISDILECVAISAYTYGYEAGIRDKQQIHHDIWGNNENI